MKFASALLALPLVFTSFVSAHPTEDGLRSLEERQSSLTITTGVGGSNVYPRLEIRQMMAQKPNQWTLFLLAMQQWQAQSQAAGQQTTYWGVSKVHGVPEENYNNVAKCSSCSSAYGYCTHNNVLFPAWHRVYMALFEQEFLNVVNSVVTQFPSSRQAAMKAAAATMRMPYWDWAAHPPSGLPVIPKVMTMTTISVDGPSGTKTIANPLYQITVDDPSSMVYSNFTGYKTTLRYPTSGNPDATSQESKVTTAFQNSRAGLQSSVYQLLTGCSDYGQFSNNGGGGTGACAGSLEGLHDTVHNLIGGSASQVYHNYGGNMANLPVAAFDPAFWLHHAMVDRIFALWQTLHPNSYGASQKISSSGGSWTVAVGSTQGPTSPLTPFYKDTKGNFWSTSDVRNWGTTFKYTYPEYTDSDGSASAIASYVNKLYGPSATATAGSTKRTEIPSPVEQREVEATGVPVKPLLAAASNSPLLAPNGSSYQYNANIKAAHGALAGSYTIWIFTAQPASEVPDNWITDPSYAGLVAMLMAARSSHSFVLKDSALMSGSVPLTAALTALVSAGKLSSMDPSVVTPYLAKNMQWRVQGPDGSNVDPATVPGLIVAATSSTLSPISNIGEIPTWSTFDILPQITKNRAGGLNSTASWAATTVGQLLDNTVGALLSSI